MNASGCAQIGARGVQMRRTVMWEDVLRAFRTGGPHFAPAADVCASKRIACTSVGEPATTEVPTESRALVPARSAGLAPVWSWSQACRVPRNVKPPWGTLSSWHGADAAGGWSQSMAQTKPITGVAATTRASTSAKDRRLTTPPVYAGVFRELPQVRPESPGQPSPAEVVRLPSVVWVTRRVGRVESV